MIDRQFINIKVVQNKKAYIPLVEDIIEKDWYQYGFVCTPLPSVYNNTIFRKNEGRIYIFSFATTAGTWIHDTGIWDVNYMDNKKITWCSGKRLILLISMGLL